MKRIILNTGEDGKMKKLVISFVAISLLFLGWISVSFSQNLDEILKKHIEALGGKENLLKAQTIYGEATIKVGGLEGKLKLWRSYPNKMRQEIDLSIFKQMMVCDGKDCWIKDQNGKVRELVGYEKEKMNQENYFESYCYLFPERGKGSKKFIGESENGKYLVVEVTPEGGEPRKLFINSSNYLIDKYQEPADEETVTVFVSDYRSIDGIMMPFQSHQTTGKPQYDTYIECQQMTINPSLDDTLFIKPHEEGKDYRFSTSLGYTKIPFELVSNHIYLKVKINNSPLLSFLLDTGAGANCLDLSLAERLGIPTVGRLEAKGVGGSADASFLRVDSIIVGDLSLLDQNLASIQLSPLGRFDGEEIDGILGYDLLNRFVVQIDYVNQMLTIWEPDSFNYAGPGERIPVLIETNTPLVSAKIDGEKVADFRIDTGSRNSLDLHAPFVREHEFLKKYPKYVDAPSGFGVGGATKGVIGRIESIQIGNFIIPKPVTGFSLADEGAFATTKSAGNIGGGILKRFKLIFDYSHNQMILEKNANFDLPDKYNMSGLVLVGEDGKIKVYDVLKNSPAEKAKIEVGDQILAVDNSLAINYSLQQIRDLLSQKEGKKIVLELERSGEKRKVKLTLKELI
jgi:outer membrane lipoprotein-sorting protein